MQHDLHVLRRGGHEVDDVVIEGHQPDPVTLVMHEIGEARREYARVIELGDAGRAEVHRLRHVEQHREIRIRLRFVFLDVVTIGSCPQLPVHAPNVVARNVAAVLGKVH
jgi:hypothetical protein